MNEVFSDGSRSSLGPSKVSGDRASLTRWDQRNRFSNEEESGGDAVSTKRSMAVWSKRRWVDTNRSGLAASLKTEPFSLKNERVNETR